MAVVIRQCWVGINAMWSLIGAPAFFSYLTGPSLAGSNVNSIGGLGIGDREREQFRELREKHKHLRY
jgi:hypothetical protein